MMYAFILLVAVAVSYVSGARIVGGQPATIKQYPYIVQVERRGTSSWSQICAANILTRRILLSAAHCFYVAPSKYRIRAGTANRSSGGVTHKIADYYNHPGYVTNKTSIDNDISVVILQSSLVYRSTIQPIAIPKKGFVLPDNRPVVHAGWGSDRSGGPSSPVLLDVEIYTVNLEVCAARYREAGYTIRDSNICAGVLDVGGRDACEGDSGGPLYYGNTLVGIVSWGRLCADPSFPGVNTRVASYTDWIVNYVNNSAEFRK